MSAEEKQAIRGLGQAINQMRRRGFGRLEAFILTVIIVLLVSAFLSIWYVIGQQLKQADRDRLAAQERKRTEQIASDVRETLDRLVAAIGAGPASQDAAIRKLLQGMEALLKRQTEVIVQREKQQVLVVYVTSSPQPTATVTCNPTPIVSRRPCH